MAAFSQWQKQRELDCDGNDTARSCLRTAGPIPALCCCYPRCLASCCALHHFYGLKASLVFFVLLFSAQAGGREADRTLGTSRGANKCRVWHSPGNGDSAAGRYWEPAGCPGIPQTMLEEPDLETALEEPNSRRFCAGLSPNGYWIVFSWVSFMSLPPVLGGHPHLERAHPHFGRGHLCLGIVFIALPPLALWRLLCHVVVFLCPVFGGPLGFLVREPGAVPSCLMCCPCPQPPCPPGWPGSHCSCQICQLMCVCVSVLALRMLPAPPSLCRSLGCRIGIPRGDGDVFDCTKGVCDVPALAFYMFYLEILPCEGGEVLTRVVQRN